MISKYKSGDFEWVDLDFPTETEIDSVMRDYGIDALMAQDMVSPTPRPRMHTSEKYLYSVMHIPVFKHSHTGEGSAQEVDMVVGEKVLITARYDSIDALHRFAKNLEVEGILVKNKDRTKHPLFGLLKEIQRSIFNELAWSDDWLSEIEKKIFNGFERQMVVSLSKAGRNILNFRKITRPHQEMLDWIAQKGAAKWGSAFSEEMHPLQDNQTHILEAIVGQNEFIVELRETNNSLLSTKQNEVMQMLTIVAMATLPASLIAALFGLSVPLPILADPHGFSAVIGLMLIASFCSFVFFKYKKWV